MLPLAQSALSAVTAPLPPGRWLDSSNRPYAMSMIAVLPRLLAFVPAVYVFTSLSHRGHEDYDPLRAARGSESVTVNWEATVPAACYTKTGGLSNPCWVCHTIGISPNHLVDFRLQEEYAFSDAALSNHWSNLFEDRSEAMSAISDAEIRRWINADNYSPLVHAMDRVPDGDFPGFRPDLDFAKGFDDDGFALDGTGWRALRYKPFPGTFWPTNGSIDDVFIRLPEIFRTSGGEADREVEKANLTILEAAIAADPLVRRDEDLVRVIEPIEEATVGVDLDGDGKVRGCAAVLRGLPTHFVGDASRVPVQRHLHPAGVEYLHSVRYVDLDSPTGHSVRMKELRWSKKDELLDSWGILRRYEEEDDAKDMGLLPMFYGSPQIGLSNDFGWRLQGFIEDKRGRLRLQTDEEARFCMGCHSAIGATVDQTFTLARKVPGKDGWRYQDLAGIPDVPQAGHSRPEVLTYLERVHGGDEFRANREMIERFLNPDGSVREGKVRAAKDLCGLVMPSERRALDLAKAYRVLVQKQRWDLGRDVALGGPVTNVFSKIENGDTALGKSGLVYTDGSVWLDWSELPQSLVK